jgi:hypothetical protein
MTKSILIGICVFLLILSGSAWADWTENCDDPDGGGKAMWRCVYEKDSADICELGSPSIGTDGKLHMRLDWCDSSDENSIFFTTPLNSRDFLDIYYGDTDIPGGHFAINRDNIAYVTYDDPISSVNLHMGAFDLSDIGNLDCYGENMAGQAADYTGGDAIGVSAGTCNTCVLKSNGNVHCFGCGWMPNDYTGGDAIGVSTGNWHTCILKSNKNVECYRKGYAFEDQNKIIDYKGQDAIKVSTGYMHACILTETRNVNCYGNNEYGQLAEDYTGGDAVGVSAGGNHTCILTTDRNVECYGRNQHGEADDYTGGDAVEVSAGGTFVGQLRGHTCVLTTSSDPLWECGENLFDGYPAIGPSCSALSGSTEGKFYRYRYNVADGMCEEILVNNDSSGPFMTSPSVAADGTSYIFRYNPEEQLQLMSLPHEGSSMTGTYLLGLIKQVSSPVPDGNGAVYLILKDPNIYYYWHLVYLLKINVVDQNMEWIQAIGLAIPESDYFTYLSESPRLEPTIGPDGTVYVAGPQDLFAIDTDGNVKWQYTPYGPVVSSPAIAEDGTIYFGDLSGTFYALQDNGDSWNEVSQYPIEGNDPITTSPVIGPDGTVYVGAHDDLVNKSKIVVYAFEGQSPLSSTSPWPMFRHDTRHTGSAASERIVISEAQIDFTKEVAPDDCEDDEDREPVTITNGGLVDLYVDEIIILDDQSEVFGICNDFCSGYSIEPSSSCTFDVSFAPQTTGNVNATVAIHSSDPVSPRKIVELSGLGVEPGAGLNVQPSVYDFGSVIVGNLSQKQFLITNNTEQTATLTNFGFGENGDFRIVDAPAADEELNPEASITFDVVFEPKSEGEKEKSWTIDFVINGSSKSLQVQVQGTGGAAETGVLTGFVKEKSPTFQPLENAKVALMQDGSEITQSTTSSNGQYEIADIEPGIYDIIVSKDGYISYLVDITISGESTARKDFYLYPESAAEDIRVISISSRFPNATFLEGIDHEVKFTATVDWGTYQPGYVVFSTEYNEYQVAYNEFLGMSKVLNIGDEFLACGKKLEVQAFPAIYPDDPPSDVKEADFRVVAIPPMMGEGPNAERKDLGSVFHYELVNPISWQFWASPTTADIPKRIPLFGGENSFAEFIPLLEPKFYDSGKWVIRFAWPDLLGLGEGEGKKERLSKESFKEWYEKIKDRTKLPKVESGFSFYLYPEVYIEANWNDETCDYDDIDGKVGVYGGLSYSYSYPTVVFPFGVPIPVYAGFMIGVDGEVLLVVLDWDQFQGDFGVGFEIRFYAGVGVDGLVGLELYARGSADFSYLLAGSNYQYCSYVSDVFNDPELSIDLLAALGVRAYALLWSWHGEIGLSYMWDSCSDFLAADGLRALSYQMATPQVGVTPRPVLRDYLEKPDYGEFVGARGVLERAVAAAEMPQKGTVLSAIQNTVFPYSESFVASSGENLYLSWLYDDPQRNNLDRSVAMFSSWDGTAWSEPVPIDDDGTADSHPFLVALQDGSVLATWENQGTLNDGTASFESMLANLEVSAAFYNNDSGQWEQAVQLTDNDYMDRSPRLAVSSNGDAILTWVANQANDHRGSSESPNQVMYSRWDGSTWSQPSVIADVPYPLIKYSVIYTGTEGHIVMSLDTKQEEKVCTGDTSVFCTATSPDCDAVGGECVDSGSVEDHELFVFYYNGSDWSDLGEDGRFTADDVQDQNPQLAIDPSGDIILVWVRGDSLASIKNFDMNALVAFREAEYISNLVDFKLASTADGKIAVVWTETAENEAFLEDPDTEERFNDSDIFAIFYDPIFDKWGGPQQLTSDEETETYLAAAFYGDENLIVVYDRTTQNNQNVARLTPSGKTIALSIPQEPPVGTDLYMLNHTIGNDLAIQPYSLYHDPLNPGIGQEVNLRVAIKNKGDLPVTEIPVVFYNGDPSSGGQEITRETVSDILKTGDTYDVSLLWEIPETTNSIAIYAVIDPEYTIQDRDRTNNVDSMHLAMPDLAIYSSSWEKNGESLYTVTARVINNGPIVSGETWLRFRKNTPDGEELQTDTIPSLDPYNSYDFNLAYHNGGQALENLIIYVSLDEEEIVEEFDEENNLEKIVILRDTVTPVIQLPDDIVVDATSPDGAKVEYEVTAEDDVDGPVDVRCSPTSGTLFPKGGPYEVQCTAFDSSGNRAIGSFNITVEDVAPVAVDDTETVTEDAPATTIDVLGNDTDVDGGPKSIASVTQPVNGTVIITNGGADLTYTPNPDYCNDGTPTDNFTYTLTPGGSIGNVFVTVTCVDDQPEIDPCIPDSQTIQYSDLIEPVTITASDIDSESLTISVTGLPDGLNLMGGCTPVNDGSSCQWTLEGQVLSGAGTFHMTVTVSDGGLQADTPATIVIETEDASAEFHDDNAVAVEVASPGGESGAFTLAVLVSETYPDTPDGMVDYGNIGLAEVSMTLAAVGPGGSYTVMCTPAGVTGTGYDAVLEVRCDFNNVAVNTYHVQATVVGDHYTGHAEDVLVVYDPSLGFATGGGWFYWPDTGDKTNFGFNMKYNKKGTNVQGSLLLIRHMPDGTIYRVKSNALYGLALGEANDGEGYGWASFSGKSTYLEPGWPEPVGNHEFVAYVEDRNEPGKDADKFWVQVFDKNHNVINDMSLSIPAADNTEVLQGGNIVVPHTR